MFNYNLDGKNNIKIKLPEELKEISGLAYSKDNHILTHNDEKGIVYKLKLPSGKVVNKFILGDKIIRKDFEGIALVKDTLFLVTSNGFLYKYPGFATGKFTEFEKTKTGLKAENNVEGLCYDENTKSLLLACKDKPCKDYKGYKAVYSFNLEKMLLENKPRFLISIKKLKNKFNIKEFSPSGIEIHPTSGNFYIISANTKAIIKISPDGKILAAVKLDKKYHKQPEGITLLPDGSLIIADEGNGGKGFITMIYEN
jgi:uncharacterized protein YjiK